MPKLKDHGLEGSVNLKGLLEKRLGVPVLIVNDGGAAVLGEHNLPDGALHDVRDGMAVILGGGVGAGEMEDGQVVYAVPGVLDAFLNEIGWHLVTPDGGKTWEYRGDGASLASPVPHPAEGNQWALEQHMAGPWLAARAVQWMNSRNRSDTEVFGMPIPIRPDDLPPNLSGNHRPRVDDLKLQTLVLQTMTQLGQEGDSDANAFIEESGRSLGTALRVFRERFKGLPFARGRIVLVSSVGERFGLGSEDRFLAAVREAAGTDDVVRSKTGVRREIAFSMPGKTAAGLEEARGVGSIEREMRERGLVDGLIGALWKMRSLTVENVKGAGTLYLIRSPEQTLPLYQVTQASDGLHLNISPQVLLEAGIPREDVSGFSPLFLEKGDYRIATIIGLLQAKAGITAGPRTGLEEGVRVKGVEEIAGDAPEFAAQMRKAGEARVALLPLNAVAVTPESARIELFTHASVLEGAEAILPQSWKVLPIVNTLPSDDPEKANRLLQDAAQAYAEGSPVVIALDAAAQEGLRLPAGHPLTLLLDPATLNQVDRQVLAAFLAQPKALVNLILDLTSGTIRRVTLQGREYYAIPIFA